MCFFLICCPLSFHTHTHAHKHTHTRTHPRFEYRIEWEVLGEVEKDLGVCVEKSLKPYRQCEVAAQQANATLGLITRSFHFRSAKTLIPLYKTFVRPKMDFAAPVWSPWTKKEMLERVQKRLVHFISDATGET